MTFNFDDVMRLRTEAAAQGIGKKLWFDFDQIMFDGFPSLYETARQMTIHQDDIWKERNELLASLKDVLENIDIPEKNCCCHISPPCNDCVENGGMREVVESSKSVIAKISKAEA